MFSRKIKGIATVIFVFSAVALLYTLFLRYGEYFVLNPQKPHDELSSLVSDLYGDKFYYYGSEINSNGVKVYSFIEGEFSAEDLYAFIDSINDHISESKEKVCINLVYSDFGRDMLTEVSFCNYSDVMSDEADYKGLYSVTVDSSRRNGILVYPETYVGMKGVRRFVVHSSSFRDSTIENGINWRSIWPEVEDVSFCPRDHSDNKATIVSGSKDLVYKLDDDPDTDCHVNLTEESDHAVLRVYQNTDSDCLLKKDIEYSEGNVFEVFLFDTIRDVHKHKLFIYNTSEKDGIVNYEYKLIYFNVYGNEVVEDQKSVCGDCNDPGIKEEMEDFIQGAYFYKDNGIPFGKVEGDQCIFGFAE